MLLRSYISESTCKTKIECRVFCEELQWLSFWNVLFERHCAALSQQSCDLYNHTEKYECHYRKLGGASGRSRRSATDMNMALQRTPVLQTHGKGKDFLSETQRDGKTFLWSKYGHQYWWLASASKHCHLQHPFPMTAPLQSLVTETTEPLLLVLDINKQLSCVVGTLHPRKHSPSSGHFSVCYR